MVDGAIAFTPYFGLSSQLLAMCWISVKSRCIRSHTVFEIHDEEPDSTGVEIMECQQIWARARIVLGFWRRPSLSNAAMVLKASAINQPDDFIAPF